MIRLYRIQPAGEKHITHKTILFRRIPSQHGYLGLITLNRPEKYNAINTPMYRALYAQLHAWEQDPQIHAVLITAAGERSFCAGGDLHAIYHAYRQQPLPQSNLFYHGYRTNQRLFYYKKPVISWIFGHTLGGGVGLSLYAQYRIGSPCLQWGMPETRIGFYPDVGTLYALSRYPNNTGVWLALSGRTVCAHRARALGIIHCILARKDFSDWLAALCQLDLRQDAFKQIHALSVPQQRHIPPKTTPHWAAWDAFTAHHLNVTHTPCSAQQLVQQLRRNTPHHPLSQPCLDQLIEKSPISIDVTLGGLYHAAHHDFNFCIQQNYWMTQTFLKECDFFEGIYAAVIDKKHTPEWRTRWQTPYQRQYIHRFFEKKGKYTL